MRHRLIKVMLVLCCFFLATQSAMAWQIKSVLVFGDAESDNGNSLIAYGIPSMPPYWHGRFSNGPVWVEYLVYRLQLIAQSPYRYPNYPRDKQFLDFAIFDALATNQHALLPKHVVDLKDEVNQYEKLSSKPSPSGSLAIIYIGENDLTLTDCVKVPLPCMKAIRQALFDAIERLYTHDHVGHFLIIGIGDLSSEPYLALTSKATLVNDIALAQKNYTALMPEMAVALRNLYPRIDVYFYNRTMEWEREVQPNYMQPVTLPCYDNFDHATDWPVYNRQIAPVCANPSRYFFYDMSGYKTMAVGQAFAKHIHGIMMRQAGWGVGARHRGFWQHFLGVDPPLFLLSPGAAKAVHDRLSEWFHDWVKRHMLGMKPSFMKRLLKCPQAR